MDISTRQLRGCGFLPRIPTAQPWFEVPDADIDRDEFTVCPGYAIGLNEVAEAVHYRPTWMKGYLADRLGEVTDAMFAAQDVLEGSINAKQASDMRKRAEEAKRGG